MNVIKNVVFTEKIAVVTIENAPANIQFLSAVFDTAAKAAVNVDMISQTAPKGDSNTLSFTVTDDRITDILQVVKSLESQFDGIKTLVSIGNVKLCLQGDEMPDEIGVAADAFRRLAKEKIEIILITTSDVDISLVVHSADADKAYAILKEAYM